MTFEQVIEKHVARLKGSLLAAKQTVATAESCTAGLISYGLTSIAGSSEYFKQGWVVYQSEAKHTELCFPRNVEIYGPECAKHLAIAAKTKAGTDWGLGVTGKADPGAGVIWWGIARPDNGVTWHRMDCSIDHRNAIRTQFAADIIKSFSMIVARTNKGK